MLVKFISSYWRFLTVTVLLLIVVGSLYPAADLPKVPGSDKSHHILGYFALMLPSAIARPKHWIWLALSFIAISGAIELIQPYVNRYGEWADMLANAVGIILAIAVSPFLRHSLHATKNGSA